MTTHKLPAEAYTSPDWFDTERDRIFGRSWLLVASTDELPHPGDYRTLDVGATPAFLLRDTDGVLRAFHNLCPHRAMTLLNGVGNTKSAITCPYHCWRFGLDGTLKVIPQEDDQFPDVQRSTHDLQSLHLDTWENLVFVSADTDPPPLSEWIDGLDAPALHRPVGLTLVAAQDIPVDCNWKIAVENHIDIYHLWYLHRESFKSYDHFAFEHHQVGRNWFSWEPTRPDSPHFTAAPTLLTTHDTDGLAAHLLFPNTLLVATTDYVASYCPLPTSPTNCILQLRVWAGPRSDAVAIISEIRHFLDMDIDICSRLQAGLRSPRWRIGPLAAQWEAPIAWFQDAVLDSLAPTPT